MKNLEKKEYIARFKNLVDIVEMDGKPKFLIKEDNELLIKDYTEEEGQKFYPPERHHIPWLLPNGHRVIKYFKNWEKYGEEDANKTLYDEVKHWLTGVSDLPDVCYYEFTTAWVFHTYLLEQANYSPIVCFFALPERGKTRTGKGLIHIAYRGVHVESLREAYIFRITENYGATLFFDVMDLCKRAEKDGSMDILLLRYEKGAKVSRVIFPEKGAFHDTVYYNIFGATIIGTNEPLHSILETRSIQINMPEATKNFENEITPELALPIKEKLLAFRAFYLDKKIIQTDKPTKARLGDIMRPIFDVARLVNPEAEDNLKLFLSRIEQERKLEKAETLEAQIIRVLVHLEEEVHHKMLPVKRITEHLNLNKPPRYHYSPQKIGRTLSAMGFQKGKTSTGSSALMWNQQKINQMIITFDLTELKKIPVIPEIPVTSEDAFDAAVERNKDWLR